MTAKTYLRQIYFLYIKIRQRQEQLDELKAAASGFRGIDYSADKIQSSPSDRMAEAVGRYADLESDLQQMIDRYIRRKNTIIGQIEQLEDARHVEVLYARYVRFKPLGAIAEEMGYEYKYLCWLHGKALKVFETRYIKEHEQSRI